MSGIDELILKVVFAVSVQVKFGWLDAAILFFLSLIGLESVEHTTTVRNSVKAVNTD